MEVDCEMDVNIVYAFEDPSGDLEMAHCVSAPADSTMRQDAYEGEMFDENTMQSADFIYRSDREIEELMVGAEQEVYTEEEPVEMIGQEDSLMGVDLQAPFLAPIDFQNESSSLMDLCQDGDFSNFFTEQENVPPADCAQAAGKRKKKDNRRNRNKKDYRNLFGPRMFVVQVVDSLGFSHDVNVERRRNDNGIIEIVCPDCATPFRRIARLTEHYKDHHTVIPYSVNHIVKVLKMKTAEEEKKSEGSPKSQRVASVGEFPCGICEKVFTRKYRAATHAESHNKFNTPCTHCEQRFKGPISLSRHAVRVHFGGDRRRWLEETRPAEFEKLLADEKAKKEKAGQKTPRPCRPRKKKESEEKEQKRKTTEMDGKEKERIVAAEISHPAKKVKKAREPKPKKQPTPKTVKPPKTKTRKPAEAKAPKFTPARAKTGRYMSLATPPPPHANRLRLARNLIVRAGELICGETTPPSTPPPSSPPRMQPPAVVHLPARSRPACRVFPSPLPLNPTPAQKAANAWRSAYQTTNAVSACAGLIGGGRVRMEARVRVDGEGVAPRRSDDSLVCPPVVASTRTWLTSSDTAGMLSCALRSERTRGSASGMEGVTSRNISFTSISSSIVAHKEPRDYAYTRCMWSAKGPECSVVTEQQWRKRAEKEQRGILLEKETGGEEPIESLENEAIRPTAETTA